MLPIFTLINLKKEKDLNYQEPTFIKKEKYKLFDQRNAYNQLIRGRARQEEINEIIKKEIHNGNLTALTPKYDFFDNCD